MKILFLIILLLIPSISIARPLLGCDSDNGAILIQLNEIKEAIEAKQPTRYVQVPVQAEQSKPIPKQNKELTINDMKIKLYILGGCR